MSATILRHFRRQIKRELSPGLAIRNTAVLPICSTSTFAPGASQKRYISYTTPQLQQFVQYDGVSDSVSKVINEHAQQHQTSVSLQALMRTGRGEFLHKSFDEEEIEDPEHTATDLVLIQVR